MGKRGLLKGKKKKRKKKNHENPGNLQLVTIQVRNKYIKRKGV